MPTPLETFIADCVAQVAARRAQEQADAAAREQAFQDLLASVKANLRGRLGPAIPQPLRQFTDYAGGRPKLEELQGYPITWTPSQFNVIAPGLKLINFTTSADGPATPLRIIDIRVVDPVAGETSVGTDWIEAVAAAAVTP